MGGYPAGTTSGDIYFIARQHVNVEKKRVLRNLENLIRVDSDITLKSAVVYLLEQPEEPNKQITQYRAGTISQAIKELGMTYGVDIKASDYIKINHKFRHYLRFLRNA